MEEEKTKREDSGLSCFIMIAAYYGIPVDGDSIIYSQNLQDRQMDISDILIAAKKVKLKARNVKLTHNNLENITLPAMVKLKNGVFAILLKVNTEKVLLSYHNEKAPSVLSTEEFESVFSGDIILFIPRKFQDRELKFGIKWFIPTLSLIHI